MNWYLLSSYYSLMCYFPRWNFAKYERSSITNVVLKLCPRFPQYPLGKSSTLQSKKTFSILIYVLHIQTYVRGFCVWVLLIALERWKWSRIFLDIANFVGTGLIFQMQKKWIIGFRINNGGEVRQKDSAIDDKCFWV